MDISPSPLIFAFDALESLVATVTISNTSTNKMRIQAVPMDTLSSFTPQTDSNSFKKPAFHIDQLSTRTLYSGSTATMTITHHPDSYTTQSAQISVTSSQAHTQILSLHAVPSLLSVVPSRASQTHDFGHLPLLDTRNHLFSLVNNMPFSIPYTLTVIAETPPHAFMMPDDNCI